MSSKKLSIVITASLASLTLVVYVIFKEKCFSDSCGFEALRGLIKPLFWFGLSASVISAFFLLFPQATFISFLKRVVSWYLPILFLITANTSIHSSHIMSVDRSQVVFAGMVVLGLISVVYAFIMRKRARVQKMLY